MTSERMSIVTAKIPADLKASVEELARKRASNLSRIVRAALESELAAAVDGTGEQVGPVESAARAEIASWEARVSETRVAAAINLARRMDTDPTNGATHARELRLLLDTLGGRPAHLITALDEIRARHLLRRLGYAITPPANKVDGVAVAAGRGDW